MKRRIRSIFILMTLCILGINIFQGYWLYSTYTLHNEQFSRTATEALLHALQKQQDADAVELFHTKISGKGDAKYVYRKLEPTDTLGNEILMLAEADSLGVEPGDSARRKMIINRDVIKFRRPLGREPAISRLPADTLARHISSRIIVNWFSNARFDLRKMDSLYKKELELRDVKTPFQLDTLHLQTNNAQLPVFARVHHPDYPIRIRPLPVNPVHSLFLQASFRQPVSYVLQKMSWLLVCSLLLLLLTTGCFLYMLSTILEQKKLSEIKNDFINNMTHELKTPIATVSAAVEAMLSFGALENAQKTQLYLNVSKNELQRLSGLVEKVLHIAVEEKKELVLQPELIRPAELIQEIISQYQLKSPKPVEFVVEIPDKEQTVQADRLHIGNTINNLIDNAIKYSYEKVTIQIKSCSESNAWRLSVRDTGIGIARSYHQAVFDRFFRVPTGDLHQVKGFGLGLSYVKQVVEKHGGHIEVRSEPSQGSEFILYFPIKVN